MDMVTCFVEPVSEGTVSAQVVSEPPQEQACFPLPELSQEQTDFKLPSSTQVPELSQEQTDFKLPSSTRVEKRRRRSLSIKEKLEIIADIESGKYNRNQVADDRDLPRSTVFTIWMTRDRIKSANAVHGRHGECRRLRPSEYDEVDRALYRWWLHAKDKDMQISTGDLIEKAKTFSTSLGIHLKNTTSWMDRFKSRHGIKLKSSEISKESDNDNKNLFVRELPVLTRGKNYCNIYCMSVIGLFYHVLPDESQIIGGSGNVGCDKRVTILLGGNMDGTDLLHPVVIGNSTALSSFKNMESLSVSYQYSQFSMLTTQIWSDWLQAFDRRMCYLGREVVLFIDACPSHFTVANLKSVSVHFISSLNTSFMPIKQGVMQCFKIWYRKLVLRDMAQSINDGIGFYLDPLSCLHFIRKAWLHISQDCIVNSYKLAGWTWDERYGEHIQPAERLPSLAQECFKLNISESIFEEINLAEESMRSQEEVTDQIILDSITSENCIFRDSTEHRDGNIEQMDLNANSVCYNGHAGGANRQGGQNLTETRKPDLSEAKNAVETLRSFMASCEDNSKSQPLQAKKRKSQPRKRTGAQKGKVLSLNPEKGLFEMTRIVKDEGMEQIGLHMEG